MGQKLFKNFNFICPPPQLQQIFRNHFTVFLNSANRWSKSEWQWFEPILTVLRSLWRAAGLWRCFHYFCSWTPSTAWCIFNWRFVFWTRLKPPTNLDPKKNAISICLPKFSKIFRHVVDGTPSLKNCCYSFSEGTWKNWFTKITITDRHVTVGSSNSQWKHARF